MHSIQIIEYTDCDILQYRDECNKKWVEAWKTAKSTRRQSPVLVIAE